MTWRGEVGGVFDLGSPSQEREKKRGEAGMGSVMEYSHLGHGIAEMYKFDPNA